MNDLEKLVGLADDYAIHKQAFRDARAAAEALIVKVQERIAQDQQMVTASMAGRVAELESRRDEILKKRD